MSTSDSQLFTACPQCGAQLVPGALACKTCRTFVHAQQLHEITERAKEEEAGGRLREAIEDWHEALTLLPWLSKQAEWIRLHTRELEVKADAAGMPGAAAGTPAKQNQWVRKLGPLGPIAVLIAKGKTFLGAIFKLKFLASFASFLAVYWALYGAVFGIGFTALVLVHELGHVVEVKRRNLPADMPVFLPGLGAYVRWQALGVTKETRALISLAGPFAGLLGSVACLLVWRETGAAVWGALARASAWLNILNLIPVWVLDGGQAANAMNRTDRLMLLTAAIGLWLIFGQNLFFLVAAGAAFRLFTKDCPDETSRTTTTYFLILLTMFALVMWFAPGHGSGLE